METVEFLKVKFEEYVAQHTAALLEGSGKKANRIHKKIGKVYEQLDNLGRVDVLKDYLNESDEYLKSWAAALLLKRYPQLSESGFVALSQSSNFFISSEAKFFLQICKNKEWDKLVF